MLAFANYSNWAIGWSLLLLAFLSGAVIGPFVYREHFLGGYGTYPRRMVRLGHIALAALGMLNLIFAVSPFELPSRADLFASRLLIAGGIMMPVVCFASAWRSGFRWFFAVPVLALVVAALIQLIGATR